MGQIIPEIVAQHAEEAALCWLWRNLGSTAPHLLLEDLVRLDNRLDAHLDGLRIGGEAAWDICRHELRWNEQGEIFALATLAFPSGDERCIETVLRAASASYGLSRPLVSALGWLPWREAAGPIERLLRTADPFRRRVAMAASAAHRQDLGKSLAEALDDSDLLLRAKALRAVGELGRTDLRNRVRVHIADDDAECRFAAAWTSSLMSDDAEAVALLRRIVEENGPRRLAALWLGVRRMTPQDAVSWLRGLARVGQYHPAGGYWGRHSGFV